MAFPSDSIKTAHIHSIRLPKIFLLPNPWWYSVLIYCFTLIPLLQSHWFPYFSLHIPSTLLLYDLVLAVLSAWNTLPPDVNIASSLSPLIFMQMSSSQWDPSWPPDLQLQPPHPSLPIPHTLLYFNFLPTAFSTSNMLC